jgi:hypothetical protein
MVEYQPITDKVGNLTAICPDCHSIMNRRSSLARLAQIWGDVDIRFPQVHDD